MRKILAFLFGLILGLVTGGIFALLLTPQPGPEIQQQIRGEVGRLIDEGRNAADARRNELEQQLESFKQGRPITLQGGDAA
ncbi:MAG: YtxH domain-containing protein [Anaerolineae bacterium]|nr:YtxH domain-containing protein [Anaerolineae bacterium]